VAILAFDGCQSLDVLGPLEVFHGASVRLREQASLSPSYEPLIVGFTGHAVRSESGARIMPDQTLQALLASGEPALDTWIVPGGHGVESLLEDRAAISEIAEVARTARRTGSVCTGAFLLGAAGLLHGRRATTHWAYCAELARAFPAVEVDTDSIFVRDGEVFSSAGVTAGIDLSLALVEDDLGHELASQVAKWLVVYVRRTGAEPQISGPLAVQAAARPGMRELATWVTAHSSEDLSVGALARRAA
jgi:transcriptional regulator GlxA family with amidase domain